MPPYPFLDLREAEDRVGLEDLSHQEQRERDYRNYLEVAGHPLISQLGQSILTDIVC